MPTLLLRHLPIILVVILRPHSILSRTHDSFRVQSSLDLIIQFHLRIIFETVRVCDLIHDTEMCSVLSSATFCCIVEKSSYQPVSAATGIWVFAVKDYTDYVMHFALFGC
jgi:hypothetical protein